MTPSAALKRALNRPLVSGTTALVVSATLAGGVAVAVDRPSSASAASTTATASNQAAEAARAQAAAAAKAEAARKQAAAEAARKAAEAKRKAAARSQRVSRSTERRSVSGGSPKSIARGMVASRGWGSGQFSCLDRLWTKESGWRVTANNPSSSAYGIPQALPGSKMASAGPGWRTNARTQIRWGLGYISSTYGTPCSAWAHSQSNGWY